MMTISQDVINDDQSKFSDPNFWNQRFTNREKSFDWYSSIHELKEPFSHILGAGGSSRILNVLNVGCGNSTFSADLLECFPLMSITNIDIVQTLIEKMASDHPNQKWIHGDATAMSTILENSKFDLVVDKGTLDALLCDNTYSCKASFLLMEMEKVLSYDGLILLISHKSNRIELIRNSTKSLHVFQVWKCDLSDEAILINAFRSRGIDEKHLQKIKNVPTEVLVTAMQDWRRSVISKATRKALRTFLLSRNMQAAATRSSIVYDSSKSEFVSNSTTPQSIRRDHCYLYVIRKQS